MTDKLFEVVLQHINIIEDIAQDVVSNPSKNAFSGEIKTNVRIWYRNNCFDNMDLAYDGLIWMVKKENKEALYKLLEEMDICPTNMVNHAKTALKTWTRISTK